MLVLTSSLVADILGASVNAQSNLGGQGYVDLPDYGRIPDRKGAGILYGLPDDPACSPQSAPPRSVWGHFYQDAGVSWLRAGGSQIPFGGYVADLKSGNTKGFDGRFASTLQNYKDAMALNPNTNFVLLPSDLWNAGDIYPCDNGDCTEYGSFFDKLI